MAAGRELIFLLHDRDKYSLVEYNVLCTSLLGFAHFNYAFLLVR